MNKNIKVGIVGAGIQGVSNALFLQKKGFNVTIFDRDNPGAQAASYGNAGHFSPYASVPLNRPDVLADVPAMLLSSSGPLALKWNYVPKMIPWFLKFIMNSTTKNMMHTAKNMHQILDLALPAYDELFDEIDLEGLVENKGILYIWNEKDLKSREEQVHDIVLSGGVKDMENYQFLMGEISAISYIHDKIKEHLHDEGDIVDD